MGLRQWWTDFRASLAEVREEVRPPPPEERLLWRVQAVLPENYGPTHRTVNFYQALRIDTNGVLTLWLHLHPRPTWHRNWTLSREDRRHEERVKQPFPGEELEVFLQKALGYDVLKAQLTSLELEAVIAPLIELLERYYRPSDEKKFRTATQKDELEEHIRRLETEVSTLSDFKYWQLWHQRRNAEKKRAKPCPVDDASEAM